MTGCGVGEVCSGKAEERRRPHPPPLLALHNRGTTAPVCATLIGTVFLCIMWRKGGVGGLSFMCVSLHDMLTVFGSKRTKMMYVTPTLLLLRDHLAAASRRLPAVAAQQRWD